MSGEALPPPTASEKPPSLLDEAGDEPTAHELPAGDVPGGR